MTLTQLRTFLAVAETGSVRAAAERLVVTQAAVSAALAALQRTLEVTLVRRDGRGLRLTEAGAVYAGYARRVLGLLDEARAAAAGETDPEHGRVRVAAVTTAGEQILPRLLAGFRSRYPDAGVLLDVGNRARVRALLDAHEVDLVIGGRPPRDPALTVHGVRLNQLVVVASARLSAARAPDGPLAWLARQTWLLREHGSGTRATTEALLSRLELTPATLTVGSNSAIRESCNAGLGVTLISRDAVARELADGSLVEVPTPVTPLRRDWHLIAHAGRLPATPALLVRHVLGTGEFNAPPMPTPRRREAAEAASARQ